MSAFNKILAGEPLRSSFPEGLVIPLWKKGDSVNPLDYRPITLLLTSYKIFAAVIAERVQKRMWMIIGGTQQGFVWTRLMEKSAVLMQAVLSQAFTNEQSQMDESPGVVLLDFKKAYDTLDRNFLLLALARFGFSSKSVDLIGRMHEGAMVQFLVNGKLSAKRAVVSGIRQGCPLVPLLFIIAVEMLALAIEQTPAFLGIGVGGDENRRHKISAFVDDSAVFMKTEAEVKHLLRVLEDFGSISGLHVQPNKSWYISLNKAVRQSAIEGIPVVQVGETVRYLGIQVGTEDTTKANWDDRLQKLRTRLAIATQVANSIPGKIMVLNAIFLPAVLFTANYCKPTPATVQDLERMQKHFLWKVTLTTDPTRHKVNPALLFTPINAGGLGLLSIPLALKRRAMKRAATWPLAPADSHTAAWCAQVHPDTSHHRGCCSLMPTRRPKKQASNIAKHCSVYQWGRELLCEHLATQERRSDEWRDEAKRIQQQEIGKAQYVWKNGRLHITRPADVMPTTHSFSDEIRRFWPTFSWMENAWTINHEGCQLSQKECAHFEKCEISQLDIKRHSRREFSCTPPNRANVWTATRLRRWAQAFLSIVVCGPELQIGECEHVHQRHELWVDKGLNNVYTWVLDEHGEAEGRAAHGGSCIKMKRRADGVLSDVVE